MYVVLCTCCIELVSRDVQVSSKDDALAEFVEIAHSIVKGGEECKTVVIARTVAVGWAVYSEDDECWKLKYDTASFSIKRCRVDTKSSNL